MVVRPRRQRGGGERFGERRRRGGVVDRADAPFGNDEAGDEIVAQGRRHRDRRRAQAGEERRQAIADAAQELRLAFAEAVIGEDGAVAASGQRRGDRMLEVGDGERRQGRVGAARGDQARERARCSGVAARQDFERDVARQERRRLRRLEIDDERNGVAARGEGRREPRPHPLGAAVKQRRGVEQQRARTGGRNGHRCSVLAEFAARWNSALSRSSGGPAMTAVRLLLPHGGLLRWHRALAERLAADGHRVLVALRTRRGAPPPLDALIETLEEWAQRGRAPAATLREPPGAWCAAGDGEADLVFDLTGSILAEPGAVVPFYDGAAGDAARDAALLDGRAPWIELVAIGDDGPRVYASALPALPSRDRLIAGRADVAAVLAALDARARRGAVPPRRRRFVARRSAPRRGALARYRSVASPV